jgi:hypothetical protein
MWSELQRLKHEAVVTVVCVSYGLREAEYCAQ